MLYSRTKISEKRQTFKKKERLHKKKEINFLFDKPNLLIIPSFKLIWKKTNIDASIPLKIMIIVPKKNIKKAVKRNLIKRRIKEAYRKNKYLIIDYLSSYHLNCVAAFIYNDNNILKYQEIENKIILLLQRLKKEFEQDTNNLHCCKTEK
ncbi:MAG TPA: ribonuclease P protein component [Bacteroidales bacterium]|nr:ribonuclease P protein component [Bacteroidales bacterium]